MNKDRLVLILVFAIFAMQGISFYQQQSNTKIVKSRQSLSPLRDAPKGTLIDISDAPSKGKMSAPIALIEFSDYECPFCSRHATGAGKDIDREFIHTGKIKLVFINNPLPIHPNAKLFAIAAICAGNQGQYWGMYDTLFSAKPQSKDAVLKLANMLHLDSTKFQQYTDKSQDPENLIDRDMQEAKELNLTATPSFAIGRVDSLGRVTVEKLVIGAEPLPVFEKVINDLLTSPTST